MLKLADNLSLPIEAVTQTFGILAVRGAGKTNTAAVMAEQMFRNHLPFVVVDPVGAWWGLRSSSDGQGPGLAIPVFGGRHGDVPLEKTAGNMIADLVVDERLSCVLDCAEFSEADKIRFLIDFAERLYRRNTDPLHLFLEEADDYAPQRPFHEQARLLRAWENVVRRGRARGLGITMITQRSAALNKNVLTQIETLIVLRTTAPNDRKAISAWVEYHGQGKELLDSLPELGAGEAWIWSPAWLKTLKRVQINRRHTFDSGATPKDIKGKRPPATLADVDLAGITKKMQGTIERAKADDPRELKRQLAELQKQLRAALQPIEARPERVEIKVPVITPADFEALENFSTALHDHGQEVIASGKEISELLKSIRDAVARFKPTVAIAEKSRIPSTARVISQPRSNPSTQAHSNGYGNTTHLQPAKQKILNGLAFLHGIGIAHADKTQLALLAGVSPTSGGYFNNLGALRSDGLINYPSGGTVALTDAGMAIADTRNIPSSDTELHEAIRSRLPLAKWKIIEALIAAYPHAIPKGKLAEQLGVSPTSGGYFNNLGSLRSLGLIDYPEPGAAVAAPVLFLE